MKVADVDTDGTINFFEFFVFVIVLQAPSAMIRNEFKKKGGKMDLKQFSNTLKVFRKKIKFG